MAKIIGSEHCNKTYIMQDDVCSLCTVVFYKQFSLRNSLYEN